MKRIILLLSLLVLFQVSGVYAQTLEDYVLEHRGDTLVVKDDFEMGAPNALYNLLQADTLNVPAGRVYMLHKNGYYSLQNSPTTSRTRKVIIAGENMGLLKTYKGSDLAPIVCGAVWEGGTSTGGMNSGLDLEVKNMSISLGNPAGGIGWAWFGGGSAGSKLTVDNCILEHTLWIMFNPTTGNKTFLKNNYFVNMTGQSCRRNGGVLDMFTPQDTILVENCTHVMAQGLIYKPRNYPVNRIIYNHNNFINCAGVIFMDLGYQKAVSLTNNMFINSQVQGYSGDKNMDPGESDLDPAMPLGLINIAHLDSTGYAGSDIHYYSDKNLAYWDPKFDDLVSYWNTNAVGGYTAWQSQKIVMNSRTQGYFDDNTNFPYLYNGEWENKLPSFTNTADLFTDQLQVIYDYAKAKADPDATEIMPEWRLVFTPVVDNFTFADFPIPVDLSYSDSDLKTAGLGGFPLGDLNWFPAEYAAWSAQKATEYANINTALATGEPVSAVETVVGPAKEFKLGQNYPNPFNPTTTINFSLPKDGFVTLKVYNAIGQEVATLLNGFRKAQTYNVEFDASNLPSGVYIYKVQYDNNSISKKMVLMK